MIGHARRGMTLMELAIGIAITGMMAAAGGAAFASIIDHRKVIRESTVGTERAAALREMIRSWIVAGTIQVQRGGGPRINGRSVATPARSAMPGSATAVSAARASGDEITFITSALNPSLLPTVRIRLFIDADDNTPETGLTIEYQVNGQAPLQRRELDATIGGLTVEYLDQRRNRWLSASEAATMRPRAVRISFLPPEKGTIPPLLQLPMIFTMVTQ
jgi:prepilin-type N-terminal cleavage/methylation domain-containing protein